MNRITSKYRKYQHTISLTAHRVIMQMEENKETFPDPPEALEKLKTLLPEYDHALSNALGRDRTMVSIKDDLKAITLNLLQELADYVTVISKGDRTTMLSSGFDVNSETGNSNKQPPAIEKLQVDANVPGEATIRVKKVTNAIAFVHQYTTEPPTPNTIWISEGSSLGTYTYKALSSDKRYWFRVIAIGYYGINGYSPIESRVIQ